MGWKLALVLVEGPSADLDAVRRRLLLPRRPDLELSVEEISGSGYDDDTFGLLARDGRVLVLGWSALGMERTWAELSRGGRVLQATLAESFPGNSCAIYEDGVRVRYLEETEEGGSLLEEGPPSPLEPARDPAARPFDHVSTTLAAVLGAEPVPYLLALDDEGRRIATWRVVP